jgi:hypothetical protein
MKGLRVDDTVTYYCERDTVCGLQCENRHQPPCREARNQQQLSGHTDFRISPCVGAEGGEVLVFCHSLRLPLHRTVSQRRLWFPDCVLSTDIPKLANVVFAHVL